MYHESHWRRKERLMYANGYLEEKRRSPASLAAVIGLHGTALAAVMIYGTYNFVKENPQRLIAINITDPQIPPPEPPPPPRATDRQTPRQIDDLTVTHTDNPPLGSLAGPVTPPAEYHPPAPPG